jgi:hypothetical protein
LILLPASPCGPRDVASIRYGLGVVEVFGRLIVELPMLAVLLTGLVLVSVRRAQLGARVANFALAGLGVLAVAAVLSLAWSYAFPYLIADRTVQDYSIRDLGMLSAIVSIILALITAAGVALLIGAILARTGAPPVLGGFAGPPPAADHSAGGFYGPPSAVPDDPEPR